MLTNQIQYGEFSSTFKVYRYIRLHEEMIAWWESTLRVQAINRISYRGAS